MQRSKWLKLNWRDLIHGAVVAALASPIGIIEHIGETGDLSQVNIRKTLVISLCAGLAYLLKKVLTNDDGKILKKSEANNLKDRA